MSFTNKEMNIIADALCLYIASMCDIEGAEDLEIMAEGILNKIIKEYNGNNKRS